MTAPPSALRRLRQNELIVSILAVTSIIGWSASLAVKRRHWAQLSPAPLWKTKGGLEPVEPYASYAPGKNTHRSRTQRNTHILDKTLIIVIREELW